MLMLMFMFNNLGSKVGAGMEVLALLQEFLVFLPPQKSSKFELEEVVVFPWVFLFILLVGERHCESQVSYPRTQHNVHGQGSSPDRSILTRA